LCTVPDSNPILTPARRRALAVLAAAPDGVTASAMQAQGFTPAFLTRLAWSGLAIADRSMDVVRLHITDVGREALG
jgi:hypothetical protein